MPSSGTQLAERWRNKGLAVNKSVACKTTSYNMAPEKQCRLFAVYCSYYSFMKENPDSSVRHLADETHAVYAIARYLNLLKLHGWCDVLMLWLGQYDGLERYLEPSENPPVAVRELLAGYVASGQQLFPKTIATDLANLPFLHYRARLLTADEKYWDPLEISFIEFVQGGDVAVWRSDDPVAEPDVTKAYLLSALFRQPTPDRLAGDSFLH